MQRQRTAKARAGCTAVPAFLLPAGADGLAQGDVGARKIPPVRLGRQHLQALQEAGSGAMAIAGGRIVILHCEMTPNCNDLTLS